MRRSARAAATSAGETSTPSAPDVRPSTTCRGTTPMSCLSAMPAGRYAVLSVTTATRLMVGRLDRDDVHQLRCPHDHRPDLATVQGAYDGLGGQGTRAQLVLRDRRWHLQAVAHLPR